MNLSITFEKQSYSLEQSLQNLEDINKELVYRKQQITEAMLSVLSQPNSFKTLVSLSLAKVTMSNVYLIHLRGLKSLEKLYLNDTQIGDEGITHLVALKKTLKVLDLTGNEHITNQSFENLRFLEKLDELYLTGTAITMNGLRMFVKDTKSKSLFHIKIPDEARAYLNERHRLYCIDPKLTRMDCLTPFIVDPRRIPLLTLAHLKIQLTFHYEVNPNICITGDKFELAATLKEILERRWDDGKVLELASGRC